MSHMMVLWNVFQIQSGNPFSKNKTCVMAMDVIKQNPPALLFENAAHDIAPFGSPQFLFSFPALRPLLSVICGNSKTCTVTISFYHIPSRQ